MNFKQFDLELDSTLKQISIDPKLFEIKGNTVIRDIQGEYQHKNYLEYLEKAWANHYGIVVSPDYFWYIISCEIASLIKNNPDKHAHLFTTTPDSKQEISVETTDPVLLPLDTIIDKLKNRIPTNTSLYLPEFSTTNERATFAFSASFADAMSVYYNYSMYMCGIPKVRILGKKKDWKKMKDNLKEIKEVLGYDKYFDGLITMIKNIIENYKSIDFWKDMFRLKKCGSGHQTELAGWIKNLFYKQERPGYISNYSSCVSMVSYKNLSTNKKYELNCGLFGSSIVDGFLMPEFGYIVNDVTE